MKKLFNILSFVLFAILIIPVTVIAQKKETPIFEVINIHDGPVLHKGDPGTKNNKYGFEGGRALKIGGKYHIFTTEMCGNPIWAKTRMAHWKSPDGIEWERVSTLFESTGDSTGNDPRAALWSPMPFYDAKIERWTITYVAYNSKPNTPNGWYRCYNGKIWRSVSEKPGYAGLAGPYADETIILKAGEESDAWEKLMGTDSFFPFPYAGTWLAFYGSSPESIGLAEAPELKGPWSRKSNLNPVATKVENPIVTKLEDGRYVALIDGCGANRKIGYMVSTDGINWTEMIFFDLEKYMNKWWGLTRTPLGLVAEGNDIFTVYFTAFNKDYYDIENIWGINDDSVFNNYFASVGMFQVKLVK